MSQKISIQKFGPINNLTFELQDLMVFTGAQASGKSTVAKCIYFFKTIPEEIMLYLFNYDKKFAPKLSDISLSLEEKFNRIWKSEYYSKDSYIDFFYTNDKTAKFTFIEGIPSLSFSKSMNKLLGGLVNNFDFETEIRTDISQHINSIFDTEQDVVYIPAGRSTILKIDKKPESEITNDYFLNTFSQKVANSKQFFAENTNRNEHSDSADLILPKILDAKVSFENNDVFLTQGVDEVRISLSQLSSGQEEVLWLALLLKQFMLESKPRFVIIEEPESNLYPKSQKEIVEIIALFINSNPNQHQVLVTTHSPYVLAVLNNLFTPLTKAKKQHNKIKKHLLATFWLDISKTTALLFKDKTASSCIDAELKILDHDSVDAVAEEINALFYKIDAD